MCVAETSRESLANTILPGAQPGLARTIYIYGVYTIILAGTSLNIRSYTVIRCIYTFLANPIYTCWVSRRKHVCRRNEQGKLGKYHPAWCTTRVGQNHIYRVYIQ